MCGLKKIILSILIPIFSIFLDMDFQDVREYEKEMQEKTNNKVGVSEQE